MNVAVILAGGIGSRLQSSIPKQFYKLAGKMVIEHTIDVFERNKSIDEIVVVINSAYVFQIENLIVKNNYSKVRKVLNGGNERYKSSLVAINAYHDGEINMIFHDAVRPLVNDRIINDVISALQKYNAVDVAISTSDTIIEIDEENFISHIPNRNKLMRGQTPQGFKLSVIKKAYEFAISDPNMQTTDDCSIVKKYLPKELIHIVRGEESNIKLTYKEDLYILDKLFQLRSISLNNEVDINSIQNRVIVIFGGSYGIGKAIADVSLKYNAKVYIFSRTLTDTNISVVEDVRTAFKIVYEKEGHIDYVINTAGVLYKEPLNGMSDEKIAEIIDVNYRGMINVAMESYTYLKKSFGGLLFFTSSSYTRGRAFYSLYSSTKAAVVNFVQALSQEWEEQGIMVNCINPERTKTPMRTKNFGYEDDSTLLTPEEVALASIKTLLSNYTGQVISVKK